MVRNEVENVCRFLATKDINIPPNNEWLTACIEWFVSENAGSSNLEIQEFSFNQLLLANLNDIAQSCLPSTVVDARTINLQGKYFLQINSFLDVGQSAYTQYKKILKHSVTVEEDEDHDGDGEEKKYWKQQPNRMLKMEMTDGVYKVYGMEYSLIPKFNASTMVPGVKVLVKGPVECRSSVLLLKETNIEILGGEVDSLYEVNHTNRLVAKQLNIDENSVPLNDAVHDVPPTAICSSPVRQNHYPTTTHLTDNVKVEATPSRSNDHRYQVKQENVDYNFFEDSDIFLNVPIDNLIKSDTVSENTSTNNDNENYNDNVNSHTELVNDVDNCEPTGNKVMELDAKVVAFKSKLIIKDDNWSLTVKLLTNNGSLKAMFDPDLLDRLIGFSPTELSSKETEISVNPAIKEKMDKMLKHSQQVIKSLSCSMTLAQNDGDDLPRMLNIYEWLTSHTEDRHSLNVDNAV